MLVSYLAVVDDTKMPAPNLFLFELNSLGQAIHHFILHLYNKCNCVRISNADLSLNIPNECSQNKRERIASYSLHLFGIIRPHAL